MHESPLLNFYTNSAHKSYIYTISVITFIQLNVVKERLSDTENLLKQQLTELTSQLREANEEIAVKVAQVKQYQKQVEAYKQQVM